MAATITRPSPDLNGKLAEARTEADKLNRELAQAEHDLQRAVDAGDYMAAESAKGRVEDLRPHVALADATVNALTGALEALQAQEREQQAAAAREARQEQLRAAVDRAAGAEQDARENAQRHLAEALAGVDAVRVSLQLALDAERQGHQARTDAAVVRAELEGTTMPPVVSPNWASSAIDRSPLLSALARGRDL